MNVSTIPLDREALETGAIVFPVVTSLVAPECVRAELEREYDLKATGCQLIERGLNDTYLLTTRTERYIARLYRAGWRSTSDIAYEIELLLHLEAKGVSVAAPIRAPTGKCAHTIPAPEGLRQMVIFRYAGGRSVKWNADRGYCAGRLLADIHRATEDFQSPHVREGFDIEHLIDKPLRAVRPFLAHRSDDWRFLNRFAAKLREQVLMVGRGLGWGVCHGDFDAHNIHIRDDGTPTAFDFDFCGPGWLVFDLVIPKWGAMNIRRPEVWDAFLDGYIESTPLMAMDVASLPLFQALRHFWGMGLRARNAVHQGSSSINAAYLAYRLEWFRKWEVTP
jgi:Ser/Thr protein kinase RdoA (MazF antagonist)